MYIPCESLFCQHFCLTPAFQPAHSSSPYRQRMGRSSSLSLQHQVRTKRKTQNKKSKMKIYRRISATRSYCSYDLVADMDFAQCNKVVSFYRVPGWTCKAYGRRYDIVALNCFIMLQIYALLHIRPCCTFEIRPCCADATVWSLTLKSTPANFTLKDDSMSNLQGPIS